MQIGLMKIRTEVEDDWPAVYRINAAAFETEAEAKLVETIRNEVSPYLSQVAVIDGEVVGHILFTPVQLVGNPHVSLMGLAPMAVAEARRGQGVGTALIESGIAACRLLSVNAVFVLGHPDYYPKFGFETASLYGLRCEYEVPDEVFMVLELTSGTLAACSGLIQYHPVFAAV